MRSPLAAAALVVAALSALATSRVEETPASDRTERATEAAPADLASAPSPTPRDAPEVVWLSRCDGDLATALVPMPGQAPAPDDACRAFDPLAFDPLEVRGTDAGGLLLLVELPPGDAPVPLTVEITEGVPPCTACEDRCRTAPEERTTRRTWSLPAHPDQGTRHLVDVGARVADWRLAFARFTATVGDREAQAGAGGWPWCE